MQKKLMFQQAIAERSDHSDHRMNKIGVIYQRYSKNMIRKLKY